MSESDALLKANLAKSHSPYYLMSELAGNAKRRGDAQGALQWYERAFDASEGPATRLQWGASYVSALVELAPDDAARIERAAAKVFAEAAAQPNAFYERSARSLQRVGRRLAGWSAEGRHAETMARLQRQLDALCGRLDAGGGERATCDALLKSARLRPTSACLRCGAPAAPPAAPRRAACRPRDWTARRCRRRRTGTSWRPCRDSRRRP